MVSKILERCVAAILLAILGLIVLHAPITVWLASMGADVSVKSWKEVLMALAALLLLIYVARAGKLKQFVHDRIIWVAGAFGLIHLVMMLVMPLSKTAMLAALAIDLRFVLYFVLVYVFIKLRPSWSDKFYKVAGIGAAIVVGFACLQMFLPIDFLRHIGYGPETIAPYITVDSNHDYIRFSSTLRGPNPLGAYAGSVFVLLAAFVLANWRRLAGWKSWVFCGLAMLVSATALWVSYSRSAVLGVLLGLIIVIAAIFGGRLTWKHWLATLAVGTLVLASGLYLIRDTSFMHNVILHDNPTTGPEIDSNTGHLESLGDGVLRMLSQPFGAGVGSTGSASLMGDSPLIIENQYLMIAHEVGWLGLAIFVGLFVLVMRELWRRRQDWLALGWFAGGVGLAFVGLLLPVWADDTVSIVWWGIAGAIIARKGVYGTKTNQKTA